MTGLARLRDSSVATKLIGLVALAALGVLAVGVLGAFTVRDTALHEHKAKTKAVVEAAVGVVQGYVAQERAGDLDRAQAQRAAAKALGSLRYDGEEYFWINDMQPVMVMHPMKPELNGQDIGAMADPDGKQLFREMVEVVKRSESGFVDYRWPKPGAEQPVPKVSFVEGVLEWGWVIGSGLYVDDVDAAFTAALRALAVRAGLILVVLVGMSILISRAITRPLGEISAGVEKLAEGRLDHEVPVRGGGKLGRTGEAVNRAIARLRATVSAAQQLSAVSSQMSGTRRSRRRRRTW